MGDPRPLAADEVLIDIRAAGVGNWDEIVRTGGWDIDMRLPTALGVEGAGVVSAIGTSVSGVDVGDDVLCHPVPLRDHGCWAPHLIAPIGSIAAKPSGMPWDIAGVFPIPALTAEQVVGEALSLRSGDTLLVHGAGGITGGMIVQLAVRLGADVIATCGPLSAERVRSYGARAVVDYHESEWPQTVLELSDGKGVQAVANAAVGGAATAMTTLIDGGRLATITSDPPTASREITVTTVYVRSDGAQLSRLAELFERRELSMHPPLHAGINDAAAALAQVVAGRAAAGMIIAP
ncbi:NADP-dependent oxidoreductase [Mycobacterium sp. NPDC003449]